MKDYKSLSAWKKAHSLVLETYKLTETFPKSERYSLTSQLLRAVTSIPTNIAEGSGRGSDIDFARFIQMAIGSCSEVEYQFLLAKDLGYIIPSDYELYTSRVQEVSKMLVGLIKKLR